MKVAKALMTEDLGSQVLLKDEKHRWNGFHKNTTTLKLLACISIKMYVMNTSNNG
jgi:hypothetical protein